ncbi:MAG: hypothetical protein LLF76_08215 [Planctomycetaceae bacterium]|nr:hypothetical protein [Planctomycetaceae bacterium]
MGLVTDALVVVAFGGPKILKDHLYPVNVNITPNLKAASLNDPLDPAV